MLLPSNTQVWSCVLREKDYNTTTAKVLLAQSSSKEPTLKSLPELIKSVDSIPKGFIHESSLADPLPPRLSRDLWLNPKLQ